MAGINLEVPRVSGEEIELTLKSGDRLFIVGAKGSGKSAFLGRLVQTARDYSTELVTAHRQTWFESGVSSFTHQTRREFSSKINQYIRSGEARLYDRFGGQKISSVLFDLVEKDNNRNRQVAQHVDKDDYLGAKTASAKLRSFIAQINDLLGLGALTVKLEYAGDGSILARRETGAPFEIAQMSDGERNAVLIAARVITASLGT